MAGKWVSDAREISLFGGLAGHSITESNLLRLAPVICLKFRGVGYRNETLRQKVTAGALATYIANSDQERISHGLERRHLLAFAVCYVSAHYALDLIDGTEVEAAFGFCNAHLD